MKRIKRLLAIIAIATTLTGCINTKTRMVINDDKEMDFSINFTVSSQMISALNLDLEKELPIAKLKNDNFKVEPIKSESGEGFVVTKKYSSIDDVSTTDDFKLNLTDIINGTFDDSKLFKVNKGFFKNTYTINYILETDINNYTDKYLKKIFEGYANNAEDAEKYMANIKEIVDEINATIEVELPRKANGHNAKKVSNDDKVYTWYISLSSGKTEINLEFDLMNKSNLYITIFGVIAVIIAIISVITIAGIRKHKEKKDNQPIHADYDEEVKIEGVNDKVEEVTPIIETPVIEEPEAEPVNAPEVSEEIPVEPLSVEDSINLQLSANVQTQEIKPELNNNLDQTSEIQNTQNVVETPVQPEVEMIVPTPVQSEVELVASTPVVEVEHTIQNQTVEPTFIQNNEPVIETVYTAQPEVVESAPVVIKDVPAPTFIESEPVQPEAELVVPTPIVEVETTPEVNNQTIINTITEEITLPDYMIPKEPEIIEPVIEEVPEPVVVEDIPTVEVATTIETPVADNYQFTLPEEIASATPVIVRPEDKGPTFITNVEYEEDQIIEPKQKDIVNIEVPNAIDMNNNQMK